MIFVCIGSRDYQFNRLIRKMDELVRDAVVTEPVIMQIGESEYEPKYAEWHRFIDRDKFKDYQKRASLIISHGGTGALVGALKMGKQVIAVPRLAKYGEHIDDHQMQISEALRKEGYLNVVLDIEQLGNVIRDMEAHPIEKKYEKPSNVLPIIETFIDENF